MMEKQRKLDNLRQQADELRQYAAAKDEKAAKLMLKLELLKVEAAALKAAAEKTELCYQRNQALSGGA
jgi:hypothetical protein